MIVVRRLGYPDLRGELLAGAPVAGGLLTVGYLVTGSVWTPVVGHVLMHPAGIRPGTELPPAPSRPEPSPAGGRSTGPGGP